MRLADQRLLLGHRHLRPRFGGIRLFRLLHTLHPTTEHLGATIAQLLLLTAQASQTAKGFRQRLLSFSNLFRYFLLLRQI